MDVSKYMTVLDAAEHLNITRWWVYRLAKRYNWRQETVLGKRVYLKRDVLRTPDEKHRRAEGQYMRYRNKKSGTSPAKD